MIPRAQVTAWRARAPWPSDAQIEQDLILSRALVEMFSRPAVAQALAFRGGSALHKLFLERAGRYSEDIDLVQVDQGAIGAALDSIRTALDPWLGAPRRNQGQGRVTMLYRFETTSRPVQKMRLKIEINTREHFAVFGLHLHLFVVENPWFSGEVNVSTYRIEELLGTKLRALYHETILQWTREALENNHPKAGSYDALLVDEGQDFRDDMLKILLSLLRPEGDLVIALDPYQDLYRKESTWKSIGIEARGTRQLRRVYRNTREIEQFARRFIGEEIPEGTQLELFQGDPICSGPPPEIIRFESPDKLEEYLIRDIIDQIHRGEYRRSEIGILYDDKIYGADQFKYEGKEAPSRLQQKLETAGIPTKWVSEDVRAKELFDITTDRVSLISIPLTVG